MVSAEGNHDHDRRLQLPKKRAKGGVVHLQLSRGHCIAFWSSVPPLQVAPSFACSVASLSRSPGLQLPGCHSLHCGILADYLLGWGRPSTCSTGLAEFQSTSSPSPHWATGDWVLPANCWEIHHFQMMWYTRDTLDLCSSSHRATYKMNN